MSALKDLTGQRFGRLTVIRRAKNNTQNRAMWECLCDCGKTKTIRGVTLRNGRSKSCGCIRSELNTKRLTIHSGAASPEYAVWVAMKQRCYNPSNKEFKNYGDRGITVCESWYSFKNFIEDMGQRPGSEYSIERVNNDKGYHPDNCKWATVDEQSNNKRTSVFICINGVRKTIAQWGKHSEVNISTIHDRIRNGWPPEKAVFHPVKMV